MKVWTILRLGPRSKTGNCCGQYALMWAVPIQQYVDLLLAKVLLEPNLHDQLVGQQGLSLPLVDSVHL